MTTTIPATCDHLLWGAADLDGAVRRLARLTGVRASPDGQQPDLGTHEAVVALGHRRYLEVIAPDPSLRGGALARVLAGLKAPALLMWAVRVDDVDAVATRAEAEGYRAVVTDGTRDRADGSTLRWRSVFVTGHGAGPLVPFFVSWDDGCDPTRGLPDGLTPHALRAETPQPEGLRALLDALDVRLPVRRGPRPRLVAELDTPRGRVELGSP
jgi:hypothetical protein